MRLTESILLIVPWCGSMNGALSCSTLNGISCSMLRTVQQEEARMTCVRHCDSVRILLVGWRISVQCHVFEFNSHITIFNAKRLDSIILLYFSSTLVSWFLGSRRAEVILLFLYLLFFVSTILIRSLLDTEGVPWVFDYSILQYLTLGSHPHLVPNFSIAIRYTSSFVLALLMFVVSIFNWIEIEFSFGAVVSVGCTASGYMITLRRTLDNHEKKRQSTS